MLIVDVFIKVRNAISILSSYIYKKTDWKPPIPHTINDLERFLSDRFIWTRDPIFGLLDHVQPIKHMNWQLLHAPDGKVRGDCDDYATYTCWMLARMSYIPYRVNMASHQHVICVYKDDGSGNYSWFSNSNHAYRSYPNMYAAIEGWCTLHGVMYPKYNNIERMDFKEEDL